MSRRVEKSRVSPLETSVKRFSFVVRYQSLDRAIIRVGSNNGSAGLLQGRTEARLAVSKKPQNRMESFGGGEPLKWHMHLYSVHVTRVHQLAEPAETDRENDPRARYVLTHFSIWILFFLAHENHRVARQPNKLLR